MASWSERPPLPCRASPPHGGRSARRAGSPHLHRLRCCHFGGGAGAMPRLISPLEGEMPGRAEGGA
ncbi:MAG: hypothetical protein FP819_18160 [Rhizobiaceae bacterium]|nr:hypothetical protein [Rhizobiaceae bacterium]